MPSGAASGSTSTPTGSAAASDLPLFRHRVIVRVRRKDGDGDVTIKLRGADLVVPEAWSEPADGDGWKFKIEGDWTGQHHSIAASLTVDVDDIDEAGAAPDLRRSSRTARSTSCTHRLTFRSTCRCSRVSDRSMPARGVQLRSALTKDVAAERWRAGSLEFFELSLRVDAAEAVAAQAAFDRFLTDRGVPASSMEESKTETVLRHFAARD